MSCSGREDVAGIWPGGGKLFQPEFNLIGVVSAFGPLA
jgi:hypothetical protein